jgi:hypothetical protein
MEKALIGFCVVLVVAAAVIAAGGARQEIPLADVRDKIEGGRAGEARNLG